MDEQLADEVFRLSIEGLRIENRKWEIRKAIGGQSGYIPSWDEVSTVAMKVKVDKAHVHA